MSVTGENHAVVVGLDVGGTKTNATVLDETGAFLVDRMVETPSRVSDGPAAAMEAIGAGDGSRPGDHRRRTRDAVARGRPRHAGAGERAAGSSRHGRHQLRRARCGGASTSARAVELACTSR